MKSRYDLCILGCIYFIGLHSALGNPPFDLVADIPLGPSNLSSSCQALAVDSDGTAFLMGHSLSNRAGTIWLAKVSPDGTPIGRKSLSLTNLVIHNDSQSAVKDMLLWNNRIVALLECKDNGRLTGKTTTYILQLSKDGTVVSNSPLRLNAVNAQMVQKDDTNVWIVGQNKTSQQLEIRQISLEQPEGETVIDITPSNSVAVNGVLLDIMPIQGGKCLLLIECFNNILDRRLQLLCLSMSGDVAVVTPPFDGTDGIISRHKQTAFTLSYKAPSIVNLGNESVKVYTNARVRVYNYSTSIPYYDESFGSSSAATSAAFPIFGVDGERIAAQLATTNQVVGEMQFLSPMIFSIGIKRQLCEGPLCYLLTETMDWESTRRTRQVVRQARLLMVKPSPIK